MGPLLIFKKQSISDKSSLIGEEVDFFAAPSDSMVNVGAKRGEITLFFKDGNTYADDSVTGVSTTAASFATVTLKVRADTEALVIRRLQASVQRKSGQLMFDGGTRTYPIKGIIKILDIQRSTLDVGQSVATEVYIIPSFISVFPSATGSNFAVDGEDLLVECGHTVSLRELSITWNDGVKNLDLGVDLIFRPKNQQFAADIFNINVADYGALPSPYVVAFNEALSVHASPQSVLYELTTGYTVDDTTTVISNQTDVHYRDRFYVVSSPYTTLNSIVAPSTEIFSTLAVDSEESEQIITVECTTDTANTSNYTYVLVPQSGTLTAAAAKISGLGIADYTDSFIQQAGTMQIISGSSSPIYNVYRSNQRGAFDSDITLNLTITH